jgi:hypothetical protein
MPDNDRQPPPFVKTALMWLLARHGGSLRIGPLHSHANLPVEELCAALNELAERRWVEVTWRRTPCGRLPERLRPVERITITRFGRRRMMPLPRPAAPHPALRPRGG